MAKRLKPEGIEQIVRALEDGRLYDNSYRALFLAELPDALVTSLKVDGRPSIQLRLDINALNQIDTSPSIPEPPIYVWLRSGARILPLRPAAAVLSAFIPSQGDESPNNLRSADLFHLDRTDVYARIHKLLTESNHPVAVQGPCGVGKTETVLAYAKQSLGRWRSGIWMVAPNGSGPVEHLAALAPIVLGLEAVREASHEERAKWATEALAGGLVILDGMNDVSWYEGWHNYSAGRLRLLIVTKLHILPHIPQSRTISLRRLTPEEGVNLIARRSEANFSELEKEAVRKVVVELDGLPAALSLVGAFARFNKTLSWPTLHRALKRDPIALLETLQERLIKAHHERPRYHVSVSEIYDDTLRNLSERDLRAVSFLAEESHDGVELQALTQFLSKLPNAHPLPGIDPADATIDVLVNHCGLATIVNGIVRLNRLLHAKLLRSRIAPPSPTRGRSGQSGLLEIESE